VKWSVGLEAEADREMSREEIVELADAVAPVNGFASGIGTNYYGAQLVVTANTQDAAVEKATQVFQQAAAQAGLPSGPIVRIEVSSEEDDEYDDERYG
jgi:hypothetical protein